MRIVGGRYRGHPLKAPKAGTRPTTDRTREAIFNLVLARVDLEGADVVDLFAGSGALGLEALSRGAARATFVEQGAAALRALRANAAALGVTDRCTVVRADVLRFLGELQEGRQAVAVFADPPYALDGLDRLPDLALPLLAAGGVFVLEHDARHDFAGHATLETARRYGSTVVSVFRREG
jgi:16S rRNA (guanine966-N2)-methyltransferase